MRIFGSSAGCLSVLFGLAFGLPALAEPSVDLDGPTAGWRYSGLLEQPDAPRVAYPTPPIDRGGQRGRSLIEGHLRELVGTERAQRLVVNGNPLPLYTDGAGRFVRPMRSATAPTASRSAAPTARSSSACSSTKPIAPNCRRACAWCWVGTIRRPSSTCISSPRWPARLLGASAPEQQRRPPIRTASTGPARRCSPWARRCTAPT